MHCQAFIMEQNSLRAACVRAALVGVEVARGDSETTAAVFTSEAKEGDCNR